MSKTVDELAEVYDAAVSKRYMEWVNSPEGSDHITNDILRRAGIAAVVRALRDEMGDPSTFKSAKPECCGRGVPNHNNTAEECCCQPDAWILHEEMLVRINEILGDAGEKVAAACATSQTEGEVHDGRISQSLSPTRRGRSEVAGPLEGSGSGATPDNQRGEEVARAVFGNHEAGRKRDVGGEGNNGLNEKVAGGSTREDEKAVEAAGDKGPVTVNSPATTPAPAVCEWTGEEYVTYSTSCESEHEVDPHKAPPKHCPSCGLPIKFTEAK